MKISDAERVLWELDFTTRQKFFRYHRENPAIWPAFEKLVLKAKASGTLKVWGAKAAMEIVRYKLIVVEKRGQFKINNNFCSYYARLLIAKHSSLIGFLKFRRVRGLRRAAA